MQALEIGTVAQAVISFSALNAGEGGHHQSFADQ